MSRPFDILARSILGCGVALALFVSPGVAPASAKVLYAFKGGTDGWSPDSGVIADNQGNLYGTTAAGGTGCDGNGCGTVFRLAPDGTETVLYAFKGGSDGATPYTAPVLDANGNLYGTTWGGGNPGCHYRHAGCGTVFRIAPDGTETVLHAFNSARGDGKNPYAGLLRDAAGTLYGTTGYGGQHDNGIVFRIAPDGTETVIYSFCSQEQCADGGGPGGTLVADKAGNIYGTTSFGGSHRYGTAFKLANNGTETVLYSFCALANCEDGIGGSSGLVMDKSGNLYGTSAEGGQQLEGAIFKLSPDGTETVLHSFNPKVEGFPASGVIIDRAGNFYGSLISAVQCKNGDAGDQVFRLAPDGSETLHCIPGQFAGGPNGVIEVNGRLYGTATYGGKLNHGIVFAVKK